MENYDDLLTLGLLGGIVLAVAGLYAWLLRSKTRAFHRALVRLRDRIDRGRRW